MNEKLKKIIGKILPTPQDKPWQINKTYDKLDFVLYKGSGYVSIKTTENKQPTNKDYWKFVTYKNTWSPEIPYAQAEYVKYEDKYYIKTITNNLPTDENTKYWKKVKFRTYSLQIQYSKYDVVSNKVGNEYHSYMCIKDNSSQNLNDTKYWVEVNILPDSITINPNWIEKKYNQYDIIRFDEKSYVKIINDVEPTNEEYWTEVNYKGTWSEDVNYKGYNVFSNYNQDMFKSDLCDIVTFEGNNYICLYENLGSHSPENSKDWVKVCEKGDVGEKGEPGTNTPIFRGTWNKEIEYDVLDVVYYNGCSYVCLKHTDKGFAPDTPQYLDSPDAEFEIYWQLICKGIDYIIDKTGEVTFKGNQITGIKTFTDNVYEKVTDNANNSIKEVPLQEIIETLRSELKYCKQILEKYQLN